MDFSEFHFLRPYWLMALIPLTLYLYFYYRRRLKQGSWTDVCDPQLLDWLLVDRPVKRQKHQLIWIALCGMITILALAGPTWERAPVPVFRNQSALAIVLDLSQSMYATDLKPNRITRARFKITDILKQRIDGQSALIVYSDAAFVVTPLSNDAETIIHQLNVLEPGLMPGQGNNTKAAVLLAEKLFRQAGIHSGQVLLITDGGGQQTSAIEAARDLAKKGHQLYVLGVGTEGGAPIPQPGGFVKDEKGSIVIPRLNQSVLKDMATAGNGIYRQITTDNSDINDLLDAIEKSANTDLSTKAVSEISQWKDRGPWLILLLIPIAALAFRRGYLVVVAIVLVSTSPESHALSWDELWSNANQRGRSAFNEKQFDEAARQFELPQWKAAAFYRAGQYDKAEEILKQLPETSDNLYNLGNAQAQQHKLQAALDSYKKALQINPDHKDAHYNKKIVEDALKQQQQQKNQDENEQSDEKQDSSEQNDKQQSGNQDQSESQDQEGNDQQQKDNDQRQQSSKEDAQSQQNQSDEQLSAQEQNQQQEQNKNESGDKNKPDNVNSQKDGGQHDQQQEQAVQADEEQPLDEADQATEQWMRRIPDDPGRLLRRKFLYQYRRNNSLGIRQD